MKSYKISAVVLLLLAVTSSWAIGQWEPKNYLQWQELKHLANEPQDFFVVTVDGDKSSTIYAKCSFCDRRYEYSRDQGQTFSNLSTPSEWVSTGQAVYGEKDTLYTFVSFFDHEGWKKGIYTKKVSDPTFKLIATAPKAIGSSQTSIIALTKDEQDNYFALLRTENGAYLVYQYDGASWSQLGNSLASNNFVDSIYVTNINNTPTVYLFKRNQAYKPIYEGTPSDNYQWKTIYNKVTAMDVGGKQGDQLAYIATEDTQQPFETVVYQKTKQDVWTPIYHSQDGDNLDTKKTIETIHLGNHGDIYMIKKHHAIFGDGKKHFFLMYKKNNKWVEQAIPTNIINSAVQLNLYSDNQYFYLHVLSHLTEDNRYFKLSKDSLR